MAIAPIGPLFTEDRNGTVAGTFGSSRVSFIVPHGRESAWSRDGPLQGQAAVVADPPHHAQGSPGANWLSYRTRQTYAAVGPGCEQAERAIGFGLNCPMFRERDDCVVNRVDQRPERAHAVPVKNRTERGKTTVAHAVG